MTTPRRILVAGVALVVGLAIVVTAVGAYLVRRPLPDHEGTQRLASLSADVEVLRDERGVPHIYADTDLDLFTALGYTHAQDRFFEMDFRRHTTAGRLSELLGAQEDAIAADTVVRTMGWRDVAEQEWELISEESRSFYEAYANGVNAYIGGREASRLGIEYTLLATSTDVAAIEPWSGVDSLAWLKAMAWDLRGNINDEIARAADLRALFGDVERVDTLFPPYPHEEHAPILPVPAAAAGQPEGGEPTGETASEAPPAQAGPTEQLDVPDAHVTAPLPGRDAGAAVLNVDLAFDALPPMLGEGDGIGSNSFVIAGEHTESGEPLLANDPHLGLAQPNLWYQVGLHCRTLNDGCTFDVTGFSFAGVPGVIIGHNHSLAWGLTNLGADVIDLTLERVYSDGTYQRGAERVPLERRTETVEVDGGAPVTFDVLSTEAGPLVSDALTTTDVAASVPVPDGSPDASFDGYAVALQWTALTPGRSGEAIFALNRATDADELAAAAELFEAPSQNIVFATTDGDIGYQAPGKIPVRAEVEGAPLPADGTWPRPGWDERFDWQGMVPADEMPAALNPAEGFVVAANQPVLPPGLDPFLTADYDYGYRSQRIRVLLENRIGAGEPVGVESANEIMLDDRSSFGEALVPYLLDVDVEEEFVREAVALLEQWSEQDYPTSVDSAGAAYFNAVWVEILAGTFADELPAEHAPDGGDRWLRVVENLLENPADPWWDDRTTVNVVETRDEILTQALVSARQMLTARLGKDPADWRWGDLHEFAPRHSVLGGEGVPVVVHRLVNPGSVEMPGGPSIVNATRYDAAALTEAGSTDFQVTGGPSMRMVVDLADLDASTWSTSSGTSGHPASGHYADQLVPWSRGETFPWAFTREAVQAGARETLVLTPGGG